MRGKRGAQTQIGTPSAPSTKMTGTTRPDAGLPVSMSVCESAFIAR